MTRNFLFTLFFIFSAFSFFAQGTTVYSPQLINNTAPFPGESCASEYAENEFLKDPAYAQTRANFEAQIQQYIQQNSGSRAAGVVYTIPVVFHVMHSGEAIGDSTNISYAQALSCINALNRDFRRTAADGGIANSGPLGVDAEIEFCMAQREPNGNATTGVTRHDMSGDQDYLDSGVYHTAALWRSDFSMKSSVNWDNTQYMNVWVVNKIRNLNNIYSSGGYSGGVQGYVYSGNTLCNRRR